MTTRSDFRHFVTSVSSRAAYVLAVSLLVLTSCKQRPLREVTLGLSWLHASQYCGPYYADQHELYANEGLRVSFVPATPVRDPMEEFLSGKYDFLVAQPDAVALARLNGHKIKAIAATYRIHPLGFASLEGSGITGPKDFRGKTVGGSYSAKAPLHAVLRKMNIDPSEVKLVEHQDGFQSLEDGTIDVKAVWVINELQTARRAGLKLNVFSPYDYGITMYADVLVARESTIEQEPELVQGFVRATLRGWTEALQDPETNSLLALRYDPALDPVHELDRLKASAPLIHTGADQIGWMRAEEWERMLQTLYHESAIPTLPDVAEIYTTRFMEGLLQP